MEHIKAPQFGQKSVIKRVQLDAKRIKRTTELAQLANQFAYHIVITMAALTISIIVYKICQTTVAP